jgi:integrase
VKGNITRRGKSSWRLKFDVGYDADGKRKIRYETINGKRQKAEQALTDALKAFNDGMSVEPSKITVAEHMRDWLDAAEVTPKTRERYRQLSEQQIIPHLGTRLLQKLRPAHIQEWHSVLLQRGGKDGAPLSARTVGHAHRVLHAALARAAVAETVARNVASTIKPPKVETAEVEILSSDQMADVLAKLDGHSLYPIVAVALGTGMRRGELLGAQWGDVDLDACTIKVERSVEETKGGLRVKPPKTKNGRRTISLPASTIQALRAHRRAQRELRVALGLGRETTDTPVFSTPEGSLRSPDNLSRDWRRTVRSRGLPQVMFHALRHSHASALIAAGLDVVTVSRRLGHGSPSVTLTVYAHLFQKTDTRAADAIEMAMRKRTE